MQLLESCQDILTVPEVAEALRISAPTMRNLIKSKQIEAVKVGGKLLVPKAYLEKFLEKSRVVCYSGEAEQEDAPSQNGAMHLDNRKQSVVPPFSEGETEMAKNIRQPILINGVKKWVTASTMQEFADKVGELLAAGQLAPKGTHPFDAYAWNWFKTYSEPNVETVTATTYRRQIKLHLIPAFAGLMVEEITTDHIQQMFNNMTCAKATKEKAKMVLNQILEAAVEDKLLPANPLKSKRLRITGSASKATPPYTVEQMRYLVAHIGDIQRADDRAYLAIQALHPLRLEEVLGLKGADIDRESRLIHICRAVTHPCRNQPEVKRTKTDSSRRTIGLSSLALPYLPEVGDDEFLFGRSTPLSYTQVRKMCIRIQKDIGFIENITPIRFRTTVLTDLYDQTKDIKLAQAAAGHTTPAMTLRYYVKGRETTSSATAAVERAYTA